jgi:hypothetical protein
MNVKPDLTPLKKVLETAMRTAVLTAALVSVLAASPARAQTYDPAYPICLQVYGIMGGYIACRYISMDQCRLSAWGRPAQCIVNPYFAGRPGKARTYRRTR